MKKSVSLMLFLALFIVTALCYSNVALPSPSQQCVNCHQTEVAQWQQSHHFQSMALATPTSVLGDFNDKRFEKGTQFGRFFKKDEQFFIEMANLAGVKTRFKVQYTFGYEPLQQYMFDVGNGKVQLFPFAWDSRTKAQGGQRWFVVHPEQQPHHEFHWSQMGQNWNQMCADCHSTDFKKGFDVKTQSYQSTFSAINVSCNACHGDETQHLAWAKGDTQIKNKGYAHSLKMKTPLFHRSENGTMSPVTPLADSKQVEVCATCHARRAVLGDRTGTVAQLHNALMPALLTERLYHVDGQVWDEDYVWGSFKQSKMHQAGVTCTNCHNPHSGKLKLPKQETCTQCHTASVFDTQAHHGHLNINDNEQVECVDCHMPTTTFMQVDARRDHSFRIPRPDLTLQLGVPNTCNQCHTDKTANWSQAAIQKWHPQSQVKERPNFAKALFSADHRLPNAATLLTQVAQDLNYPNIVRASALARMATTPGNNAIVAIARAIKDDDPLKRQAAIVATSPYQIEDKWRLINLLLDDQHLSVRIEAARALAPMLNVPFPAGLTQDDKARLNNGLSEYTKAMQYQADRGYSHTNLGNLARSLRQPEQAEQHYLTAIKIEPIFMPAYANLAEHYRQLKQNEKSMAVLLQALGVNADDGAINFALAMAYVRQQKKSAALPYLAKAVSASPQQVNYLYTYALLLQEVKQIEKAAHYFLKAYELDANNPDINYSLSQVYSQQGQYAEALFYARNLARLVPNNQQINAMVLQLEMMQQVQK